MLLLGVLVFGEPFDLVSAISFGLIWIGLGFFSYSQYLLLSKDKQKRPDIPIRS
jgi:EamA domain-containing membrane protein RarD